MLRLAVGYNPPRNFDYKFRCIVQEQVTKTGKCVTGGVSRFILAGKFKSWVRSVHSTSSFLIFLYIYVCDLSALHLACLAAELACGLIRRIMFSQVSLPQFLPPSFVATSCSSSGGARHTFILAHVLRLEKDRANHGLAEAPPPDKRRSKMPAANCRPSCNHHYSSMSERLPPFPTAVHRVTVCVAATDNGAIEPKQ